MQLSPHAGASGRFADVLERVTAQVAAIKIGDPLDPAIDMGRGQ